MYFKPGIIQGRLTPPIENHIQEFPKNNWEQEFYYMQEIGLNHIEWIITKKSFEEGALDLNIKKYANKISSICCDNLIDCRINNKYFLTKQLRPVCEFALKNEIRSISIPLLEDSKFPLYFKEEFIGRMISYGQVYPDLDFCFEMEAHHEIALELINSCNNFYYTYDTGNITSCGYDHKTYLDALKGKIRNVHLKDRTKAPISTVEPGMGDTNFQIIFDILKKNNYIGLFTIQTARGKSGEELETIKKHIKFYEQFI